MLYRCCVESLWQTSNGNPELLLSWVPQVRTFIPSASGSGMCVMVRSGWVPNTHIRANPTGPWGGALTQGASGRLQSPEHVVDDYILYIILCLLYCVVVIVWCCQYDWLVTVLWVVLLLQCFT